MEGVREYIFRNKENLVLYIFKHKIEHSSREMRQKSSDIYDVCSFYISFLTIYISLRSYHISFLCNQKRNSFS